jgi:hypothetical protein
MNHSQKETQGGIGFFPPLRAGFAPASSSVLIFVLLYFAFVRRVGLWEFETLPSLLWAI